MKDRMSNFKSYYSILTNVYSQLQSSIDNNFNILQYLTIDDIEVPNQFSICLNTGRIVSFDKVMDGEGNTSWNVTLIEKDVENKVANIANFDEMDEALFTDSQGISYTLASITSNLGETYRLNSSIWQITANMLNNGTLTKDSITTIVNSIYDGNTLDPTYSEISLAISSLPETVRMSDWVKILGVIYTPLKQMEETQSLELDSTVNIVHSFVGYSVLSIITGILDAIGLILTACGHIIGLLFSVIGRLVSWLVSTTVNTGPTIDPDSETMFTNQPFLACSVDYSTDLPWFNTLKDRLVPNGPALYYETAGKTVYAWRISNDNSDKVFFNVFITLNINPNKLRDLCQNVLNMSSINDACSWFGFGEYSQSVAQWNPSSISLPLPIDGENDVSMTYSDIYNYQNDSKFWALSLMCSLVFALYPMWSGNDGMNVYFTGGQNNRQCNWTELLYYVMLECATGTNDSYLNDYTEYWADMVKICTNVVTKQYVEDTSWTGIIDNFPYGLIFANAGITAWAVLTVKEAVRVCSRDFVNLLDNENLDRLVNSPFTETMLGDASAIPTGRLLEVPTYTNDALKNSLFAFAGIVLAISAVYLTTKYVIKPKITSWAQRKVTALDSLKKQAITTGNTSDWNKFLQSSRRYNLLSSVLGVPKYDVFNGRFSYNSAASALTLGEIIELSSSSENNMDNIKQILNLIK